MNGESVFEEKVFSLFIYFHNGKATEVGALYHKLSGSDEEKRSSLQRSASDDQKKAKKVQLTRQYTPEEWLACQRLGDQLLPFEVLFAELRAPKRPIYVLSPIVDGQLVVDQTFEGEAFRGSEVTDFEREGSMDDYLVRYMKGDAFDFTQLIHDDYFVAIKLLFNAGIYVSASKLLMSCIDTLSFIDFGDINGNFVAWLNEYCDLSGLGISADELWEFRNSILHMTNLSSRKVIAGKRSRLTPCIGGKSRLPADSDHDGKSFDLQELIVVAGNGIGKWAASYNADRSKFEKFIERYDTTISDSRFACLD
jgi:hypothetical protein